MEDFYTKIVGVTFHHAQDYIPQLRAGETLRIERELDNPYDVNAIAVYDRYGRQLGYFSRAVAEKLAPRLDMGDVDVRVEVSEVTGGSGYTYGVNIHVTISESHRERLAQESGDTPIDKSEVFFCDIANAAVNFLRERYHYYVEVESRTRDGRIQVEIRESKESPCLCFMQIWNIGEEFSRITLEAPIAQLNQISPKNFDEMLRCADQALNQHAMMAKSVLTIDYYPSAWICIKAETALFARLNRSYLDTERQAKRCVQLLLCRIVSFVEETNASRAFIRAIHWPHSFKWDL